MNTSTATAATGTDAGARPKLRLPWPMLLGPLAMADALRLDGQIVERRVAEQAPIFRRGEVAEGLVILVDGQAMVGHAESGQPLKAERVLHGPDWLDMSSAWCDGNFSGDALAQSPVAVATLPLSALRTLLGERPALALRFVDLLAREVCRLGAQAHELMHKDAPSRLAAWLGRQLDADGRSVLHLAERKRDIASQLGMTPETLSRLMRSLTEQGLIRVEGYTVRVLDAPALARLAGA